MERSGAARALRGTEDHRLARTGAGRRRGRRAGEGRLRRDPVHGDAGGARGRCCARTARRYPAFAARLRERDLVAQIRLAGKTRGRAFTIRGGKVRSRAGFHPAPDLTMIFDTAEVAVAPHEAGPRLPRVHRRAQELPDARRGPRRARRVVLRDAADDAHRRPRVRRRRGRRRHAATRATPTAAPSSSTSRTARSSASRRSSSTRTTPIRGRSRRAARRFTPPRKTTVASHTLRLEVDRSTRPTACSTR